MRPSSSRPHQPRLSLSFALLLGAAAVFSSLSSTSAAPIARNERTVYRQAALHLDPKMARNLRNDDGTVNLDGLKREGEYIKSKYEQNAKNYEANTGMPFHAGPDRDNEGGGGQAPSSGGGGHAVGDPHRIDASVLKGDSGATKSKYETGIATFEANTGKSFSSTVETDAGSSGSGSSSSSESKQGTSFLSSVSAAVDGAKIRTSSPPLGGVGIDVEKRSQSKYAD